MDYLLDLIELAYQQDSSKTNYIVSKMIGDMNRQRQSLETSLLLDINLEVLAQRALQLKDYLAICKLHV